MQVDLLGYEEAEANGGFNCRITMPYTDFTSETSGAAFEVLPKLTTSTPTLPAGTRVEKAAARVSTAFVFAPGTLVFEFGDGGDTDRFIASTSLKTAAWINGAKTTVPHIYDSADTIDILVTAGAGALSSITAGELIILLQLSNLNNAI
jgi:hypothetical protein